MQTFVPFADFKKSAAVLDKKRCWKQVVEAKSMIALLENEQIVSRWRNHTAVRQWKGYVNALKEYFNVFLHHCKEVHCINTKMQPMEIKGEIIYPPWLGYEPLHASHRGRLLEKNFDFYKQYGWREQPCGYIWAVDKDYNLIPEIQEWRASTSRAPSTIN